MTTVDFKNVPLQEPEYIHIDDIAPVGVPISTKISIEAIMEQVRAEFNPTALNKCEACGQWGAAYCPCRHCGTPIDPEVRA